MRTFPGQRTHVPRLAAQVQGAELDGLRVHHYLAAAVPRRRRSPSVHLDLAALANSLETVPLFPTTATTSRTGVAGESCAVSPSQTLTLPSAQLRRYALQISALGTVTGATPVTVATAGGKVVNGVGLAAASSFLLGTPTAIATVQYDGSAWRIIVGQQDTGWVALSLVNGWAAFGWQLHAGLQGDWQHRKAARRSQREGECNGFSDLHGRRRRQARLNCQVPNDRRPVGWDLQRRSDDRRAQLHH